MYILSGLEEEHALDRYMCIKNLLSAFKDESLLDLRSGKEYR